MEVLYDLKNIFCSYDKEKVILEIDELLIPKGKFVFFVGASGVGKSTILETLGMMNNTLYSVDRFNYKGVDMCPMWSKKKSHTISSLRNNDFSFIFQQNNLMPNFTAYENAMTAALFQGKSVVEARKMIKTVFGLLQLPLEDRPIHEYSGGQQQRISFARAIIPNFSVLFGDEPTGNLDSYSADNLMGILANVIRQREASAIIVSHDLKLALNYADMIVVIHKKQREDRGKSVYGKIDSESVFTKDNNIWTMGSIQYNAEQLLEQLIVELK